MKSTRTVDTVEMRGARGELVTYRGGRPLRPSPTAATAWTPAAIFAALDTTFAGIASDRPAWPLFAERLAALRRVILGDATEIEHDDRGAKLKRLTPGPCKPHHPKELHY
jgi:hypothetical protein